MVHRAGQLFRIHLSEADFSSSRRPLWIGSLVGGLALALTSLPSLAKEKTIQFWNLTENTLTELYFAPSGTDKWSDNQCLNDKDKTVETDELVALKNVSPGIYDIRFKDEKGRTCLVRHVEVKAKENVSIREKELKDCTP